MQTKELLRAITAPLLGTAPWVLATVVLPTVVLAGPWSSAARGAEHEFRGNVVEVIDGDTLRVAHDGKTDVVHLRNVDAPELAQPYGDKARRFCQQLCLADQVRVVWEERDDQGIMLVTIHEEDGFNVNFEMVKAGLAWDVKALTNDRTLAELEAEARKAKRGLWADARPVAPWEFRKQHQKQLPPGGNPSAARPGIRILQPLRW